MLAAVRRLAPLFRLTRVTTAFAAIANAWFVILWTRANLPAHEPGVGAIRQRELWIVLAGGAVTALGLFAYATAMNDILDLRRDRLLRPARPLPAGRLGLDTALAVVIATLLAAILGATVFGIQAVLLTLLVACAVLVFNSATRFIPGIGLVTIGLISAAQMLIPNVQLRFVWPVWLAMTHALVVATLVHIVGGRNPALSRRAAVAVAFGWMACSAGLFALAWRDSPRRDIWPDWVSPLIVLGPGMLVCGYIVFVALRLRHFGFGARASEKIGRYGSLWLALYACAWLVGHAAWREALILGTLTAAGFAGMTVLRELYALVEQPLVYRR